eukprot:159581-Pyramimonas_sp.AAC.1
MSWLLAPAVGPALLGLGARSRTRGGAACASGGGAAGSAGAGGTCPRLSGSLPRSDIPNGSLPYQTTCKAWGFRHVRESA